jgi:hypothetical protein
VQKQKQHTVSELYDSKQSEIQSNPENRSSLGGGVHIAGWYSTHHIIINHPRRLINELLLEIDAAQERGLDAV